MNKTFFDNNYGVSIICNDFTQGVELAVLIGNISTHFVVDEEVYSGLSNEAIDSIIKDVSSRKPLSNLEVEKLYKEYKRVLNDYRVV
tara:strand:- start:119 stop:379 length:261 start_codon:yes stop_codon:yes gene_type:complete